MNLLRLKDGNDTNQKFNGSASLSLALVLACFAISPMVEAVVPAPDGGYPGGNTAEGQAALLSLTTGGFNTAVGWLSLRSNTDATANTAVGAGTLVANTAGRNTAVGAGALLSNTIGTSNTANGAFALFSNMDGDSNTATGDQALFSNTSGGANTASGYQALLRNTTGLWSTATGYQALYFNTTGSSNTANGFQALWTNTTGSFNTAFGRQALSNNEAGQGNTAIGHLAGLHVTGSNNTCLGQAAGSAIVTASNTIAIGIAAENAGDRCYINNIRGVAVGNADGIAVLVDSDGQLGTANSSSRFKKDIEPMDHKISEAILALKPVTFRYKNEDNDGSTLQFGLVAEDVLQVNPDLVVCNKDGDVLSVRYDAVNAMLLNEFLKEHRKVQEQDTTIALLKSADAKQEAIIAKQQKQIEALTAGLQKVSAQLEASKPALQKVKNNQ